MRKQRPRIVGELRVPVKVVSQNRFKIFPGADLDDGLVEWFGGAKAFGIPRGDFAEHHAAAVFAEDLDHQVVVLAQDADAFVECGLREQLAGLNEMARVLEDPRVVKRAATNRDAGTSGGL